MDEKFIVVWTIDDGETTRIPHSTQDAALHQAEKLLRKHGCDLEITLHLDDEISPQPSMWFNKKADAAVVSCRIPPLIVERPIRRAGLSGGTYLPGGICRLYLDIPLLSMNAVGILG